MKYDIFLNRLVMGISERHPDVCFYVYGSIHKPQEFVPGISDIDGGLILDSEALTDKEKILDLADIFASAKRDFNIETDFNLSDTQTNNDGRFLSYNKTMTDFIKRDAKVLSGPIHFIEGLYGLDYRNEDLQRAAYNLRSLRNRLFYSIADSEEDYESFVKGVRSNLQKAIKFPKQLILTRAGKLITSKSKAREILECTLEGVNLDGLVELTNLSRNPRILSKRLSDRFRAIDLLAKSLESVELIVQAYIKQFPEIDYEKECRMFSA